MNDRPPAEAVQHAFSQSYAQARVRFRDAAKRAEAELATYTLPGYTGPEGEALTTDVARLGSSDAPYVMVIVSGTHGAEGYCGSGCQVAMMQAGVFETLPSDVCVVLVHAINPYGFAHCRRVNEDNIDLNRNSVDFSATSREPTAYAELHDLLIPKDWHGPQWARAQQALEAFVARHGLRHFQSVVSGGQYSHAEGLFYGGQEPAWSTRTFHDILRRFASHRERVALIDLHTGLGPLGYGELIFSGNDPEERDRAIAWYGQDVRPLTEGGSASTVVSGPLINSAAQSTGAAEVTSIAIEYGTLSLDEVLEALRAEHWLNVHGEPDSELARSIKQRFRDSLYVDTPQWKDAVVARAIEVVGRGLKGLAT